MDWAQTYETLSKALKNGDVLGFGQKSFVSFYKAFVEGDRWKLYLRGIGVTLELTVAALIIGVVLGVLVGLCRQTCITEAGGISLPGITIGILCFVLLQKFKLSVPKVIGIAAVLGLVCFGVF